MGAYLSDFDQIFFIVISKYDDARFGKMRVHYLVWLDGKDPHSGNCLQSAFFHVKHNIALG